MSQLITGEKTPQQMKDMRECGKMLATIYDELKKSVTAGMSELDANDFVAKRIKDFGAEATYLTDEVKFPGVICISTNEHWCILSRPNMFLKRAMWSASIW